MSLIESYGPEGCDFSGSQKWLPIVDVDETGVEVGGYHVLVSHVQLDYLIGTLMQMCELTGDIEQRTALKNEIKQRSRRWLNDLYSDGGYEQLRGMRDGYKVAKLK